MKNEPLSSVAGGARVAPPKMSLTAEYKKSLKPLDIEEPIDVWVHRPLAFLLAKALYPTSVSPNLVTLLSMCAGLLASALVVTRGVSAFLWVGLAVFASAVLDCADGQLARLRKSSSAFGRMLDGASDFVVVGSLLMALSYVLLDRYAGHWWTSVAVVAAVAATAVTTSFHTAMYDHYKNLYLRMTHASYREGEDYDAAIERYRARVSTDPWWLALVWRLYMFYLESQLSLVQRFDPHTRTRIADLPSFGEGTARLYVEHAGRAMRVWRSYFGFGTLIFGLAVSIAFDIVEYYVLFRLVVLNAFFFFYLRPLQRAGSREAFARIGQATAP